MTVPEDKSEGRKNEPPAKIMGISTEKRVLTEQKILAQYEQQLAEAWYKKPLRIIGWIAIGFAALLIFAVFVAVMFGL